MLSSLKIKHIFYSLSTLFLMYSLSIYLQPVSEFKSDAKAGAGKLVWQKYNCQSCHQLYSLGGYLGPDLTNVMSHPGKGENLVRAMVATGTKQMPSFELEEGELDLLIEFLKAADKSGKSDPRNFETDEFGMIESK